MIVRIIRACHVAGRPVTAGDIIEVDQSTANTLIHCRRAVVGGKIETRDPVIETRDPSVDAAPVVDVVQPKRGPGRPRKE